MVAFFKYTIRTLAVPAAIFAASCFLAGSPEQVQAADTTAKIHILTAKRRKKARLCRAGQWVIRIYAKGFSVG